MACRPSHEHLETGVGDVAEGAGLVAVGAVLLSEGQVHGGEQVRQVLLLDVVEYLQLWKRTPHVGQHIERITQDWWRDEAGVENIGAGDSTKCGAS